jgi:hypothetical protein
MFGALSELELLVTSYKDSGHTQLITAIRDVHEGKRYLSPEIDSTVFDNEM